MKKVTFLFSFNWKAITKSGAVGLLASFLFSIIPSLVLADGGMVVWPPSVHLDQSAQNAIVAWSGEEEIIILSNDIKGNGQGIVLRVVPLPSNPIEIKEGSFESFEKLVEIMNAKIEQMRDNFLGLGKEAAAPSAGVEIVFQKKVGAHDLTVVRVQEINDFLKWIEDFIKNKKLQAKELSQEFKIGVSNYLKRDIKYFVFDVIDATKDKESIKPLIYRFSSDFLYYPLKITAISEVGQSSAELNIFFITEKEIPKSVFAFPVFGGWFGSSVSVELNSKELKEVSPKIAELFGEKAVCRKVSFYGKLSNLNKDIVLYPNHFWEKDLKIGDSGKEVEFLQKILINEEVWDSNIEATGYFGLATKKALSAFQEKYRSEILKPLGLEYGTGYFGRQTASYFKKFSLDTGKEKRFKWQRDLYLGARGEDVKNLQEILIEEGVWESPEVKPTGFFGPITKKAVIKFQEKYQTEILLPLGLTKGTGFVGFSTRNFLNQHKAGIEKFCGWSTYGKCATDGDCQTGGCSGQVCESKLEEPITTTCQWKDCYNAKQYNLNCRCLEGKCQWSK